MDRMLLDLVEGNKSNIWLILLICFILYAWTTFVCYLPLWISCSQTALSIVSAIGAGLMVGAAFTVVIPESINDALADMGGLETEEAALSAYRLIGICVTVGFGFGAGGGRPLCFFSFHSTFLIGNGISPSNGRKSSPPSRIACPRRDFSSLSGPFILVA